MSADPKDQVTVPAVIPVTCGCGAAVETRYPHISTFEDEQTSVIAVPHTQGVTCAQCGAYYGIRVLSVELVLGLVQCKQPASDDRKVLPFSNLPKGLQ